MSFEEDTINPIINFIHKLLGDNLWILPVSIAIASWCIFIFYPEKWVILYIAIICSIIAILHIFSSLYIIIKRGLERHKTKIKARKAVAESFQREQANIERRNREHASAIWKYVGHLDTNIILGATLFLSLDIHDNDKHIRFVRIPDDHFSDEGKLYNLYLEVIQKLTFNNGYNSSIKMITDERVNDIIYFHIEPYFLGLIENFNATKNWTKI